MCKATPRFLFCDRRPAVQERAGACLGALLRGQERSPPQAPHASCGGLRLRALATILALPSEEARAAQAEVLAEQLLDIDENVRELAVQAFGAMPAHAQARVAPAVLGMLQELACSSPPSEAALADTRGAEVEVADVAPAGVVVAPALLAGLSVPDASLMRQYATDPTCLIGAVFYRRFREGLSTAGMHTQGRAGGRQAGSGTGRVYGLWSFGWRNPRDGPLPCCGAVSAVSTRVYRRR